MKRFLVGLALASLFVFVVRAAQQIINIGTTANDNTGDTLRVAFQKINSNFTDLYVTTVTNGGGGAGNGIVKLGTNLNFATSSAYTPGLVPYASGTGSMALANLFYDSATGRFTIGSPTVAGAALLTVGGSSGITDGIYIGSGSIGNGNNLQLYQSSGDSFLSFGKSSGSYSFNLYDTFNQITFLKARGSGIIDLAGNWRFLNVGASKLVGTDSSTNLAAVTIGSGLTFDGTTLSAIAGGTSETNVQNNFYTTNLFYISGKGNSLIVTQTLQVSGQYVYPLAAGTGITFTTNNIGTGQTNITIASTSTGGGVSTAVTTMTYGGTGSTNALGFDCTTNNATFVLTLTNHVLFGASTFTGIPNTTTNMFFTLGLKQDSAGTWVPKFTNTLVAWADGVQPVIKTNANAVSYLYFHTHLFTNGMLVGSPNINVQ